MGELDWLCHRATRDTQLTTMASHQQGHRALKAGYRALMGSFPTGVAVVTALDHDGRPHGMTCTSLCSVSLDPPTLLVSVHVRSGTHHAMTHSGCFALNLLHADARRAAQVFSSPVTDRFRRVAWQPSRRVAAPWLVDDAFALAECQISDTLLANDHRLVLGEVVETFHTPGTPLLYGMRQFYAGPAT